ncbi:MAG: hypothetical protein KJ811_02620, partial [Candidatus Margulisbacteria bacterium]|nr:hypothetical protein [Candidatus Margulisiibacteriota bacterium]
TQVTLLEEKLAAATTKDRRDQLLTLIYSYHARLNKLEEIVASSGPGIVDEIEKIEERGKVEEKKEPDPPVNMPAVQPREVIPEVVIEQRPEQPKREPRFRLNIGGNGGLFGTAIVLGGEVRGGLGGVVGPATTAWRIGGRYAQTEDSTRRYALINVDGILNFPAGWFSGVPNYLGGGLNYALLTTGGRAGTFGGELFYGVETTGFGGNLFGEIGFSVLRTGFSPSCKGATLLFGWRNDWGIL